MNGDPGAGPTLLPCPFCGGVARVRGEDSGTEMLCEVSCQGCRMFVGPKHTKREAIAAWHRRVPAPPPNDNGATQDEPEAISGDNATDRARAAFLANELMCGRLAMAVNAGDWENERWVPTTGSDDDLVEIALRSYAAPTPGNSSFGILSDSERSQLRALLKDATPGPWKITDRRHQQRGQIRICADREGAFREHVANAMALCPHVEANAALIVALRNLAPRLVGEM